MEPNATRTWWGMWDASAAAETACASPDAAAAMMAWSCSGLTFADAAYASNCTGTSP